MRRSSTLERELASQLVCFRHELPRWESEFRFDAKRKWRFDFAWVDARVAAEIMGSTWTQGRHTRGAGYQADAEKRNAAILAGWQVFTFTAKDVRSGVALKAVRDFFRMRRLGLEAMP